MHNGEKLLRRCALVLLAWPISLAAEQLTLIEAERLAVTEDPTLASLRAKAMSLEEKSVADRQLPDPKLKLALANFPTDTFSRKQEPMTQIQVGIRQMFPPGSSLEHSARRSLMLSQAEQALAVNQERDVRRQVRESWLESYYWVRASDVIRESRALFEQLVTITRSQYAAGRQNQQDVIQAQLELDLLNDREISTLASEEIARAKLAQWIGREKAKWALPDKLSVLPTPGPYETIETALADHPFLLAESARISATREAVALARQAYKPGWMLDVTYGFRDEDEMGQARADFLSAMVLVDLPLFTAKRQDKRLASNLQEVNAAVETRETRYRDLRRTLDETWSEWIRVGERVQHYEDTLLPRTRQNAEAALNAYQTETGDFSTLVRARITELDTKLQALRLQVDRTKVQAALLYLTGEKK